MTQIPVLWDSFKNLLGWALKNDKMKLTKRQLLTAQQAVGYAVMYAKTKSETAEFALLKLDIDGALIRLEADEQRKAEHDKMGCPFHYCDSNPPCKGKCHYA